MFNKLKKHLYDIKLKMEEWKDITFNFDEWLQKNRNLEEVELYEKIYDAERIAQLIGGGVISLPFGIIYKEKLLPEYDKFAHVVKGYLTAFLGSSIFNKLVPKYKKYGKLFGLASAAGEGALWEEYQSETGTGVCEAEDALADTIGGFLSFLITCLYERKIEKIEKVKKTS